MAVVAQVLGIAQDGGLPQAGCDCRNCAAVRRGELPRRHVACLALIDDREPGAWIIDVTPDFPEQLHALREAAPGIPLRGVLITHAHMGHYAGLIHLGRESMNTRGLPLYAADSCRRFLETNGPWSQLIRIGNVAPVAVPFEEPIRLTADLSIEAVPVPHRAEYSETVAYRIQGPARTLFYCPDIDRWDAWDRDLREFVGGIDVAVLDGTFYDSAELPERNRSEIPHPPVVDTARALRGVATEIRFTHLNHTNPLHCEGAERSSLRETGFDVTAEGQTWTL